MKNILINLIPQTRSLITKMQTAHPEASPLIIVGLSGGGDSVFLLHLLHAATRNTEFSIAVAHLNHNCRDTEDARDEKYCRELVEKLGIDFLYGHIDTIEATKKWNGSNEEFWRHKRKIFLNGLMTKHNALGLALGHNANDHEENFFIRLIRGSALEGLCGMSMIDGHVMRPLLETRRSDIEAWLTENKISWNLDRDNIDPRYLRTRIRENLIPVLENLDDRFHKSFTRTVENLKAEQELVEILVAEKFADIFDAQFVGDLKKFTILHPHLQGHLLKKLFYTHGVKIPLSQSFLEECFRFLTSPRGGTHEITETASLVKKQNSFFLSPAPR